MCFFKLPKPVPQTLDNLIYSPGQCFKKCCPRSLKLELPQLWQFIKIKIIWFPAQTEERNTVGSAERSEKLQFFLSPEVNFCVHLDTQNSNLGHWSQIAITSQTSNISITQEFVRNKNSKGSSQTCRIKLWVEDQQFVSSR